MQFSFLLNFMAACNWFDSIFYISFGCLDVIRHSLSQSGFVFCKYSSTEKIWTVVPSSDLGIHLSQGTAVNPEGHPKPQTKPGMSHQLFDLKPQS